MATIREGSTTVLVIVDVQVGVMKSAWDAPRIVGNVARAVEQARAMKMPVIWVQHSDEDLVRDTPEWQWVPELVPLAREPLIHKHFNSSFEETPLEEELARLGASHIVLAGAATNWCIRATAYGALDRGYDLTLVKDAHSTQTMTLDDGTRIEAETLVRDLNIAMSWVSYPKRANRAVAVEEMNQFAAGGARP